MDAPHGITVFSTAPSPTSTAIFSLHAPVHARLVRGPQPGGPMRCARILLSPALSVLLVIPSATQQAASSTQASQLLQQSLAALQGNASLTDEIGRAHV